jgi:hypothetical protein
MREDLLRFPRHLPLAQNRIHSNFGPSRDLVIIANVTERTKYPLRRNGLAGAPPFVQMGGASQ